MDGNQFEMSSANLLSSCSGLWHRVVMW